MAMHAALVGNWSAENAELRSAMDHARCCSVDWDLIHDDKYAGMLFENVPF